jgi:hypothetical protein
MFRGGALADRMYGSTAQWQYEVFGCHGCCNGGRVEACLRSAAGTKQKLSHCLAAPQYFFLARTKSIASLDRSSGNRSRLTIHKRWHKLPGHWQYARGVWAVVVMPFPHSFLLSAPSLQDLPSAKSCNRHPRSPKHHHLHLFNDPSLTQISCRPSPKRLAFLNTRSCCQLALAADALL